MTQSQTGSSPLHESSFASLSGEQTGSLNSYQHRTALLLIFIQLVLMLILSQNYLFCGMIAALGFLSLFLRQQFEFSGSAKFRMLLLLLMIFMIKHTFAPYQFPMGRLFIQSQFTHAMAEFFISLQTLYLFYRHKKNRLPLWLAGFSMAAIFTGGNVKVSGSEREIIGAMALLFAVSFGMFSMYSRRVVSAETYQLPPSGIILFLLVIGCISGLGWSSAVTLHKHERELENLVLKLIFGIDHSSSVGYSGTSRLGSVQAARSKASESIALRVQSPVHPGYLRGKVYDQYRNAEWKMTSYPTVLPLQTLPASISIPDDVPWFDEVFQLRKQTPDLKGTMTIWQNLTNTEELFAPLKATHLSISETEVLTNSFLVLKSRDYLKGTPYTLLRTRDPIMQSLTEAELQNLTDVSQDIAPQVRELAEELFKGCETNRDKMKSVTKFFSDHFEYQFGISIPRGEDPLTWFLLNKVPAHCEYFASGAALLLRLGNVPCRYVTGFAVMEQNQFSQEWIVRNKHAHSWVEAWDKSNGWTIVEATPASGFSDPTPKWKQFLEAFQSKIQRLSVRWRQGGIGVIFKDLGRFLLSPFAIIVLLFLFRNQLRKLKFWSRKTTENNPLFHIPETLSRLWEDLAFQLEQRNWFRQPSETLHQFSQRLDSMSESTSLQNAALWIKNYASLRYQPNPDPDQILELEAALQEWKQNAKRE